MHSLPLLHFLIILSNKLKNAPNNAPKDILWNYSFCENEKFNIRLC